MNQYIVVKKGVYRHDLKGVSNDLSIAVELAEASARNEIDDYHCFHVVKLVPGYYYEDDGDIVATIVRIDSAYERGCDGLTRKVEFDPPKIVTKYGNKS